MGLYNRKTSLTTFAQRCVVFKHLCLRSAPPPAFMINFTHVILSMTI